MMKATQQRVSFSYSCFLFFATMILTEVVPVKSAEASFADSQSWNRQCQDWGRGLDGGYCIHRQKESRNQDVVYHFHGASGSQHTWGETFYYPEQLRQFWKAQQKDAPTVVSISFGPVWLLAEKNQSEVSGLFELMIQELMPRIESTLGKLQGRRILVGESMGGFNAAQMALKTGLFQKAALLCAPMVEGVHPFSSAEDIERFIQKSVAWQYHSETHETQQVVQSVNRLLEISRMFFPTLEDWSKADPLTLISKNQNPMPWPALYLAVGFYDSYAIYEGNETFQKRFAANGGSIEWRPQWGGHCAMDIPSLSRFLVE